MENGYTQGELERRLRRMEAGYDDKWKDCTQAFKLIHERLARGAETFALLELKIENQTNVFQHKIDYQNREIARIDGERVVDRKEQEAKWKEVRNIAYAVFLALLGNLVAIIIT